MKITGLNYGNHKKSSFKGIKSAENILKPLTDESRTLTGICAQRPISDAKALKEKLRQISEYWRKGQQS